MEKIKVNMSPNPLDVQTIHASQNDTEAREWGFELHNNGDVIDSSEITDQLVFKAYKGGTEQILPENTSTPTTSPFFGDIRYPQGLLTDQEFTYRQSPTEGDGLAKITDIKGNTLVWNQLVQNGNFVDTSGWGKTRLTLSASNNVLTATVSEASTNKGQRVFKNLGINDTHKRLYSVEMKATSGKTLSMGSNTQDAAGYTNLASATATGSWQKLQAISSLNHAFIMFGLNNDTSIGDSYQVRNVQVFDLTQMGLDSITADEFTKLYPLSYYSYNQGSLLSFNGNGIKTVGKNLWDEQLELGTIDANGNNSAATNRWRSKNYIPCFPNTRYVFSKNGVRQNVNFQFYDADKNYLYNGIGGSAITTPSNAHYLRFFYNDEINVSSGLQLEFGTTPSSYEPYTSSTLSLPISTYFPTGMKSAGNVYDELTESKAITRIGVVDLGTITYTYDGECFIGQLPSNAKVLSSNRETLNSITPMYQINNWTAVKFNKTNMTLGTGVNRYICIFNSSYTDPSAFKTAMNGVYLYYELANPTETSFITASLVTENAEIPLSNDDGVLIGKCTEQLSENPGFIDAKIKLTDSDGECYSNKLQLHVERSPQ